MKKRALTLLELVIVIALLALTGSLIGIKLPRALEKKRCATDLERVKESLIAAQKLSVSTQTDWRGLLKKEKDTWVLSLFSEDKRLKPVRLHTSRLFFKNKEIQDLLEFDFFSSGYTLPEGSLILSRGEFQGELHLPEIFQRTSLSFPKKHPLKRNS